jgi:hypothetical protein
VRHLTAIASLLFDPSPQLTRDARALVRFLSTATDRIREFYRSLGQDPVFAAGEPPFVEVPAEKPPFVEVSPRASPTPLIADVPPPLWEDCPRSVSLPSLLARLDSVRCSGADAQLLDAVSAGGASHARAASECVFRALLRTRDLGFAARGQAALESLTRLLPDAERGDLFAEWTQRLLATLADFDMAGMRMSASLSSIALSLVRGSAQVESAVVLRARALAGTVEATARPLEAMPALIASLHSSRTAAQVPSWRRSSLRSSRWCSAPWRACLAGISHSRQTALVWLWSGR